MNNRSRAIKWAYYVSVGLFSVIFIASILLTVFDAKGSAEEFTRLSFPAWLVYPTAIAKALGVIAITLIPSRSLKDFAYAGFFYDLLLALGAHLSIPEPFALVPLISLAIGVVAYTTDRLYHDGQLAWFGTAARPQAIAKA